ncbi:MAG: hypothetical protein JW993_16490 [Sedimentisphaerales bacterium]|nr:hypothetical protein [Sedimentisphaerales bacterium]
MISVGRVFLTGLKLFLMLVVTAMIAFQIPELRYDLGSTEPVQVTSVEELSPERFGHSTFASVHGTPDLARAATFAKHGVRFTYFLLNEYGSKLVVRTAEPVDEKWLQIEQHLGRLRSFDRMPFSRSVRAGFRQQFDVTIPDDAFFLARDDVPKPSGWSIGATIFAGLLWCVLAYLFFVHRWKHKSPLSRAPGTWRQAQRVAPHQFLLHVATTHHGQPEPAGDQPGDDRQDADENPQQPS